MNAKENKKKQIMLMLIENYEPITVSTISSKLNVSPKTIRNYLQELEMDFHDLNIELVKKPSIGIYLNIDKEQRILLKEKLNIVLDNIYSSTYRQKYIL